MSAYDWALQALDALAPEDVSLVLRRILDKVPLEEWPGLLLNGHTLDEVEHLMLYLTLSFFTPLEHAELIGMLMDKLLDRLPTPGRANLEDRAAAAKMLSLSTWVQACAEGNPQWPR